MVRDTARAWVVVGVRRTGRARRRCGEAAGKAAHAVIGRVSLLHLVRVRIRVRVRITVRVRVRVIGLLSP